MKYIKLFESLYSEKADKYNNFIKTLEERESELRKIINKASTELKELIDNKKLKAIEIDNEYLEEIDSYMVDLEDYKFHKRSSESYLCKYVYSFKSEDIGRFEDMIFKLNSLMSKDTFTIAYSSRVGSISMKRIEEIKLAKESGINLNIAFTFKK